MEFACCLCVCVGPAPQFRLPHTQLEDTHIRTTGNPYLTLSAGRVCQSLRRAPVREGLRREWVGLQFFDAVHLVSNWCNHLSRGGQSIMSAAACERRCEASPGMNRCQPAAVRRHSSRRVAVTASVFFYFPLAVMSLMSRSPNPNVIFIKSYSPRVFFLSIKMTFSGA